jgi:hypothetical protein
MRVRQRETMPSCNLSYFRLLLNSEVIQGLKPLPIIEDHDGLQPIDFSVCQSDEEKKVILSYLAGTDTLTNMHDMFKYFLGGKNLNKGFLNKLTDCRLRRKLRRA